MGERWLADSGFSPANQNRGQSCVSHLAAVKQAKRALIQRFAQTDNWRAFLQAGSTLLLLALLWLAVAWSLDVSWWLTALLVPLLSLMLLRVFVLMHECGHNSLFGNASLNRGFGFVFGVLCGMPQQVWSQHHQFHHANNGNWDKYRGPLNVITVDEYAALTPQQQARYRRSRSIWLAPLAGFMYLLFNPRINWLRGSIGLLRHTLARPAGTFSCRYWSDAQQYRAMSWNNLALLPLWLLLGWALGPLPFVLVYVASLSLAGGAGIVLFTVQHNFDHAYASSNQGWDYDQAALHGTSFLILPGWLNWLTLDIAYHHIHHLSARIPNYRLRACHAENAALFGDVPRITLAQIPRSLQCILWDKQAQRIISVAQYRRQSACMAASQ
jgi:omega-6 fatty acid desaturase (delta-12 desaturase)